METAGSHAEALIDPAGGSQDRAGVKQRQRAATRAQQGSLSSCGPDPEGSDSETEFRSGRPGVGPSGSHKRRAANQLKKGRAAAAGREPVAAGKADPRRLGGQSGSQAIHRNRFANVGQKAISKQ